MSSSLGWLTAECHIQSMSPSYYFVDASICMLHLRLMNPLPCLPLVPLTVFSLLIHPSVVSFAILTLSLIFANYSFIHRVRNIQTTQTSHDLVAVLYLSLLYGELYRNTVTFNCLTYSSGSLLTMCDRCSSYLQRFLAGWDLE